MDEARTINRGTPFIKGGFNGAAEASTAFREHQHRAIFRMLLSGFVFSSKHLPVWFLRAVGIPFAVLFMLFNYKNTLAIAKNMRTIDRGTSPAGAFLRACRMYTNYAFYLIDLFYISHDPERIKEYLIKETGKENMARALDSGKGVILLTSHIGNWEMGGPMASRYFGGELNLVYSPDSSYSLEAQRKRIRQTAGGVREIALQMGEFSSLKILRVLEEGGVVALQGDRLTFDSGVSVPFFGSEAVFPKGPTKLAMLTGAVVLPVFFPIVGYKSYEIIVDEPIVLDDGLELKENLSKIVKIFEKYIKRYPTQWFTFMPFWEKDKKADKSAIKRINPRYS